MIDTPMNSWFPDESIEGSLWMKLPDSSRLWVYVADRVLSMSETERLAENSERFTAAWVAHGTELTASWKLQGSRVLLIALDEVQAGASGCSIDASVQFMQRLGEKERPSIDWMRRDQVVYQNAGSPVWAESTLSAFWMARKAGLVLDDTLVVNTLCSNKGEWKSQSTPLFQESWHSEMWK
tara:strand:+ start:321 stop:863 length:543 start_codon:yes stop_codon:yes gene_type:complete